MDTLRRMTVVLGQGGVTDEFIRAAVERARSVGISVAARYVIDPVWFRYSAADWLSTGSSRAEFDAYMRATLTEEGERALAAFRAAAEKAGVPFTGEIVEGAQDGPER